MSFGGKMKNILAVFVAVILVGFLSYFSWQIGKKINYKFSYQSMVQSEIRDMVKQEALK